MRQIEQGAGNVPILVCQIDAADEVGIVLLLSQPARGRAGGAALGQHIHRTAVGLGFDEGVGVDRHEQVRTHTSGTDDALTQRHEIVAVARQHRAHVGFGVDLALQAACDRERDVLLVAACSPDCAGIFAAVAGVEHDGEQPIYIRLGAGCGVAFGGHAAYVRAARLAAVTDRSVERRILHDQRQ